MEPLDLYVYNNNENTEDELDQCSEWRQLGIQLSIRAALHPLEYAKILMQLGYEPIAPRRSKSIFGEPVFVLPSIFQYVNYIRRNDGFYGCYRGLGPKMIGSTLSMVITQKVSDKLGLSDEKDKKCKTLEESFKKELKRNIVLSVTGIVVSQPFHVISVRMMAQFVGRETIYNSVISSAKEIYNHEGILGFFSGIVPKIISDVTCIVVTSTTLYVINKHIIKDTVFKPIHLLGMVQYVVSSFLYPLNVVSTCMTVSGSRLMAGCPPIMPLYTSWMDCWNDLQLRGELKRGNSPLWRTISCNSRASARFYGILPPPALPKIQ